jgi:hypothetical protein
MYIRLHVKYRYSCQIVIKLEFSQRIFEKHLSIICHENPFSGSRVVPRGRSSGLTDGQTDMTELIVAFRSFSKAPKNLQDCYRR